MKVTLKQLPNGDIAIIATDDQSGKSREVGVVSKSILDLADEVPNGIGGSQGLLDGIKKSLGAD